MKTTTVLLLLVLVVLAPDSRALLLNATCVCGGPQHSCLISGLGDTVCWGDGANGRLGYGSTTDYLSPAAALAAHPGGVQATQPNYTVAVLTLACGVDFTMALLADGEAHGWGENGRGQLGLGDSTDVGDNELPWQAPGGAVTLSGPARDVCCSRQHCCAVMDSPNFGKVACWGEGGNGALGFGDTRDIGDSETVASAGFVDVGGSGIVTAICCGGDFTLALMDNASLRGWGDNSWGQLGLGHRDNIGDDELPSSQLGIPVSAVTWVSAGWQHACIVLSAGQGKCWGAGNSGRLGSGSTGDVDDPSTIGFIDFGPGTLVVQLEAYWQHTCGLLTTGDVMCFGSASQGRLGCDGCSNRLAPTGTVALSGNVSALSVGTFAEHTIVVHPNGSFQAWGLNSWGQLGYGNMQTVGDNETPASIGDVNFADGVNCLPERSTRTVTVPGSTTFGATTFLPSTFGVTTFGATTFGATTFAPSMFGATTFTPSTFGTTTFAPSTTRRTTRPLTTFGVSTTFAPSTFGASTFGQTTVPAMTTATVPLVASRTAPKEEAASTTTMFRLWLWIVIVVGAGAVLLLLVVMASCVGAVIVRKKKCGKPEDELQVEHMPNRPVVETYGNVGDVGADALSESSSESSSEVIYMDMKTFKDEPQ